jgi:hypothetical protein
VVGELSWSGPGDEIVGGGGQGQGGVLGSPPFFFFFPPIRGNVFEWTRVLFLEREGEGAREFM